MTDNMPSPLGKYKEPALGGSTPYQTSKAKGLLRDALEVVKASGSNGRSRYTIKALDEKLSFDKGFYVFIRAVQLLVNKNKGVVLVGLAGPSGSGKSVFSEKVSAFIPDVAVISLDMYNDASRLIDSNFDDPRLTDYDLLLENLKDLREGKTTKVPIYSFKESKRVGYREQEVPKSRVVIIEGIYALSKKIRGMLDLRVSIAGGVHLDLVKRVLRDIDRSGQDPATIVQQISDTVYPMYKAYIEPDLETAHLRIYNTFNPFSGFMNATYILKSDKTITKQAIKQCLKADHICKMESEMLDIYLLPPGEDPETCPSWLRMRNRDGRYDLRFEEWVVEDPFVISPRISFEVSVRILGGLMALGYEIGTIMKRTSTSYSDDKITIKLDQIEGMDRTFVQVQGKERELVGRIGTELGLDGTYIPRSYIEQVQLEKLTATFQKVPEDLRHHFSVDGEQILEDGGFGKSPSLSPRFGRTTGFSLPDRPTMASSAPVSVTKLHRSDSNGSQVNGLISQQLRAVAEGQPPSRNLSRNPSRDLAALPNPGPGHDSSESRGSSSDLNFPFDDAENCGTHQNGGAQNGVGHPPRDVAPKADRVARSQMAKVERMLQAIREQIDNLAARPDKIASQIDCQVQALTLQQQTLNRQVQEIAEALRAGVPRFRPESSPSTLSGYVGTPAFAVLAGGASALAVGTLLKLLRY